MGFLFPSQIPIGEVVHFYHMLYLSLSTKTFFHQIGPLGQFGLVVAMSVCVFVCVSVCPPPLRFFLCVEVKRLQMCNVAIL